MINVTRLGTRLIARTIWRAGGMGFGEPSAVLTDGTSPQASENQKAPVSFFASVPGSLSIAVLCTPLT